MDFLIKPLLAGINALAEYLSAHVLTCLIPALFIAGAITVFIRKEQILRYMGPNANKVVSYGFASLSGTLLAVCSCTILPLFAGIRSKGAGLGPAITFLFSGPAINILAITYTASALGFDLGVVRGISAILLSIVIGMTMALLFKEGKERNSDFFKSVSKESRSHYHTLSFFVLLVSVLIVATAAINIIIKAILLITIIIITQYSAFRWFKKEEVKAWFLETWRFTKMIFPIILLGVFLIGIIGFFLPYEVIAKWLSGNSLFTCLLAAAIGAILYMPTLLEVPIVGTIFGYKMGIMGSGPALALLLAGPGVSLPSLLVTRSVLGTKKTAAYAALVLLYSALAGFVFGIIIGR